MLFTELVDYLRAVLGDFPEPDELDSDIMIPSKYTDERLAIMLAVSIKHVQTVLRIPNTHKIEVNVSGVPYFVSPFVEILCDEFIELVILRVLCMIQKRDIEDQYGMAHIKTGLGPATLSTGDAAWGKIGKHIWDDTSPCAKYEQMIKNLMVFDPRKLQAIFAVLPANSAPREMSNREQGTR